MTAVLPHVGRVSYRLCSRRLHRDLSWSLFRGLSRGLFLSALRERYPSQVQYVPVGCPGCGEVGVADRPEHQRVDGCHEVTGSVDGLQ
ncbi:hypothetical protein Sgri01_07171 [Streptomyces griseus]